MEKIKSITTAKKLFDKGAFIRIVPNKMRPDNMWGLYNDIKKIDSIPIEAIYDINYYNNFNRIINDFKYYNCSNETGLYLHFYLLDDN